MLAIIFLLLVQSGLSQMANDSIDLRIYNDSKHRILELLVTSNGQEYMYSKIDKHNLSSYMSMPYIWSKGNQIEITIEKKRILRSREIIRMKQFPIDHFGDIKHIKGKLVMNIKIKTTKKGLQIKQKVVLEKGN